MKPITFLSIFFLFLFIFSACQKDDLEKPQSEPGYPTVYKPLSAAEWESRNADFQKINIHESLSLNEYGFVEGEIPLNEFDTLNTQFVVKEIDNVLTNYREFMGIPKNHVIDIEKDCKGDFYFMFPHFSITIADYFLWLKELGFDEERKIENHAFSISQNVIDEYEFRGSVLHFNFSLDRNTIEISGNWFPEAINPAHEVFNEGDAISIAYRVMLNETGKDFWERKQNFQISKLFFYKYSDSSIEIHKCWKISVVENEGMNDIYIDTQTGEIIYKCVECFFI